MLNDTCTLTYEQQQAVERIQELMANGMSSNEAIALMARALRARSHRGKGVSALGERGS